MPNQTRVYATPAAEQSVPSISVIIPCYNHGDFLTEAVESVLTQPVREVEIIIVNDGSTDRSKNVALELIERYPDRAIRVVDQPNSGEPAISRNNGINLARGEYILPLDADDYLAPGVLTRYLEAIEPYRGEPVVVYGWMQRFGAQNSIWKTRKFHSNELLRRGRLPNCSLFSRSLWESHGGYQLGIPGYEDWEFWIGCAAQGARFIHIPEVVYHYRIMKQDSMGKSGRRRHEWLMAKIFRMHPDLYEDEELAWADDYLAHHPEPPAEREIHGSGERFPMAVALLIAAYPNLYEPAEIRRAAEYLNCHPPVQRKGLRTMSVQTEAVCSNDVRQDQSSQLEALQAFREAQHLFVAERFSEAENHMAFYREKIDYERFEREDRRRRSDPSISVIVVAYQTKQLLLECLESLMNQRSADFEVILVDNGGNDEVNDDLKAFALSHIRCPINLILSEGRNVGAYFARGRILAFLDDDALVDDNYISSIKQAFDNYDIIAFRGKVLAKTPDDNNCLATHYDYGDIPIPATVNTEGNSAVLRQTYLEIGGQDPLLFGAEGMEMSYRIFTKHGDNRIIYWPETIIHHDYAVTDDKLKSKLDRYERVKRYLTGKYGDIFNWHYGYERYRVSDKSRRWGESLIPPIFDHRSQIIDDQQSTINNRKVVLEKALSEKDWSEKLPLYEKVFDEMQELQKVETPEASIVVISWRLHPDTLINFQMLELQRDEDFELIFVDNGGKPGEFDTLKPFINTYVRLNSNAGAYLARNIGAVFAKAPVLIFLDDDGISWENFVHSHIEAHRTYDVIAVRGAIMPKTHNPLNQQAKHYYPGERCFPIFADVEGNVSYKATAFFSVKGWDDEIRFGGGGFDLSRRLLNLEPDKRKQIYSPHPRIYHDYACDDEHLRNKREKQDRSRKYLRRKHPDYDKFLESWNPYRRREDLLIPKRKPETQTTVGLQKELIGSNRMVR